MPITSCLYLVGFDFFGIILHGVPASKAGDRADRPYMATAHRQVVGLSGHWGRRITNDCMYRSAAARLEVGLASAIDPAVKCSGGALARVHGYSSSIREGANPTVSVITQEFERSQCRRGESCELTTLNY